MAARAPLDALTALVFATGSRLRGKAVLHPDGVGFEGRLTVRGAPELEDATLLGEPGEHRVLVRASRGLGLPARLPDALGLAFRVPDLYGPGRHQDVLVTTAGGDLPWLHDVLVPAPRGPLGQPYSTALPYRIGGVLRTIGLVPEGRAARRHGDDLEAIARAAAAGEAAFTLATATRRGRWEPAGRLVLGARLPHEQSERLRMDPWNTGGGIVPAGFVNRLRKPAYPASQAGRLGG